MRVVDKGKGSIFRRVRVSYQHYSCVKNPDANARHQSLVEPSKRFSRKLLETQQASVSFRKCRCRIQLSSLCNSYSRVQRIAIYINYRLSASWLLTS